MANPILPGIPAAKQALLYRQLMEYNRERADYKETGIYVLVIPYSGHPCYSLWLYDPALERKCLLYIHELSPDVCESLRIATTMLYYSRRRMILTDYNEKRMRSNGDDVIFFGKYRGHFLHEILKIDPAYLNWIGYKFTPKIPKQERFVQMARAYYSVHIDIMLRKKAQQKRESRYIGNKGDKVENLALRVIHVYLEDDPYKTRLNNDGTESFYVRQVVTATDRLGNRIVIKFNARYPSRTSCTLPGIEHAYRIGEMVYIASARVLRTYTSNGIKYTRLSYVKLLDPANLS